MKSCLLFLIFTALTYADPTLISFENAFRFLATNGKVHHELYTNIELLKTRNKMIITKFGGRFADYSGGGGPLIKQINFSIQDIISFKKTLFGDYKIVLAGGVSLSINLKNHTISYLGPRKSTETLIPKKEIFQARLKEISSVDSLMSNDVWILGKPTSERFNPSLISNDEEKILPKNSSQNYLENNEVKFTGINTSSIFKGSLALTLRATTSYFKKEISRKFETEVTSIQNTIEIFDIRKTNDRNFPYIAKLMIDAIFYVDDLKPIKINLVPMDVKLDSSWRVSEESLAILQHIYTQEIAINVYPSIEKELSKEINCLDLFR